MPIQQMLLGVKGAAALVYWYGDRGLWLGGRIDEPTRYSNTIDYINIASTGNATDFGNLTGAVLSGAACSDASRGVRAAGGKSSGNSNVIEYITISSTGNATDFGDLTAALSSLGGAASNATRGLFFGGYGNAGWLDTIDNTNHR